MKTPVNTQNQTRRLLFLTFTALVLGLAMAAVAVLLIHLIEVFTNLFFFGRLSMQAASPAQNSLGLAVIAAPVAGGLIVGLMARYGSKAIRGHGIPEAMEQILENKSRIPARITWLKPLSAAISIGSGGPFGAEGPIIATGGAGGSLLGQLFSTTAIERKTLLAAGAAAGMSATFNAPVSAVLLAIELLLFEFKPRSFIPVALASAVAASARNWWGMAESVFPVPAFAPVAPGELAFHLLLGAAVGALAVAITKSVYFVEDHFEKLPIHWMWWPALGAVAIGLVGYFEPKTLGVGYSNITDILNTSLPVTAVACLCALKFVSWCIALGSGTSGGTLAPLLTFGSGAGLLIGSAAAAAFPSLHIQPALAALVGMAALFTGASQALLASVVFACETTGQVQALLPLLGGCATALMTARLLAKNSIMSEKIVRRGVSVPSQYEADVYAHTTVGAVMETDLTLIPAETPARELLEKIAAHDPEVSRRQAYLLGDGDGNLAGIVTRGDLVKAAESPDLELSLISLGSDRLVVAYPDETLHAAIEKLLHHEIGRLPVVERHAPGRAVGYLSRAAILSARARLLHEESHRERGWLRLGSKAAAAG